MDWSSGLVVVGVVAVGIVVVGVVVAGVVVVGVVVGVSVVKIVDEDPNRPPVDEDDDCGL